MYLTLGGGIGNQLFQLAYAMYCRKPNEKIKIVTNHLLEENIDCVLHTLNLDRDKNVMICSCAHGEMIKGYYKFLFRFIFSNDFMRAERHGVIIDRQAYNFIRTNRKIHYIEGGFQSAELVNSLPIEMLDLLRTQINLPIKSIDSHSVCVHVRRGDYLSPKYEYLQVCDEQYYARACDYFKNIDSKVKFFVFSNNINELEWIKSHYKFLQEAFFVDLRLSDIEIFALMQCFKNYIISNSTFSWWASKLSRQKNKVIVAPKIWNKTNDLSKEIYDPSWVLI